MSRKRDIALAVLVAMVATGPVLASGFSIYEQSAKASGRAGAWVASADDPAANWYNPAALARLDHGFQFQFGVTLIPIGRDTQFEVTDPTYLLPYTGSTTPQTYDAESSLATPFNLYFSQKVNDRIAWGVGITTPFGLMTEWSNIPVTLSAKKSELVSFVVNPNIAFTLGPRLSLAFGIDYLYADVKAFSRVIDQSSLLMQPPGTTLGESNLTGTGDDWGWNVALLYSSKKWSFGLTYRAELSPTIEGDLDFSGIAAPLQPFFPDSQGSAQLDLPAEAALGIAYRFNETWDLEFDLAYAGWSSFETLDIKVDNDPPGDVTLLEEWDNTYSYRLGASCALAEKHDLRFGLVYDEAPVPDQTMRPSIPDAARTGASVGYGYKAKTWGIDAFLMPLFFADATATGDPGKKPLIANPNPPPALIPNPGEVDGVIDGTYTSSTILFGVSVNFKF